MRSSRRSHRPPSRCRRAVPARVRRAVVFLCLAVSGCGIGTPLEEWTLGLEEDLVIGAEPVTPQTGFYHPAALGFDHQGRVFVLDSGNHRVQVFGASGDYVRTIGGPGDGPGELRDPQGMFVHADGRVWIADTPNRRIQPYAADGRPLTPVALDFAPLDVIVAPDRLFVLRMPQASLVYGPDPAPLIGVVDHRGNTSGGFVEATPSPVGILYMLQNMLSMAPGPDGGVAVSSTHFDSIVRVYRQGGQLSQEIDVLYKAGAWAPLGRRPAEINDVSIGRIARTTTDLAWDSRRQLFWVLAGYVDQTPEGDWIIGREAHRYGADGRYRGSVMLPHRATALAVGPDGRLWTIDIDGAAHAFRVTDPDVAPS